MMEDLVDTHAHLDDEKFVQDQQEVINRAKQAGVKYIINIGTNLESSRKSVELAYKYEGIYAAVGVHPHDALTADKCTYLALEELAGKDKVVAMGEIGLDYYRDYSPRQSQQKTFRQLIRLAKKVNLPIIIHCRQAAEDVLQILEEEEAQTIGGVFHAFSGEETILSFALETGFYLSITGVVTFENSKLSKIIASIPLERLLIETDCPYLTPVPYRGKRNEPAYLVHTAERVAEILDLTPSEVARINKCNASQLFKVGRQM